MFPKDSAFTGEPYVNKHLKKMREEAVHGQPQPQSVEKVATQKAAALDLLAAAKLMLEHESYGAAVELLDEAIEALEE